MASSMSRRKKRVALGAAVVLTFSGAGAAYAFWSSTGTGDGTATTGTSTNFTVTPATAVGTITPGGVGQTVNFTVTNNGPGTQSLTGVTVTMANAAGVAWVPPASCNIAWYTASVTTQPVNGQTAVLQGANVNGQATVTLSESGTNQDACKNASVPLHFVVNVPVP